MKVYAYLLICLLAASVRADCDCTRTDSPKSFGSVPTDFVWEDVVIDGDNLGKPISIGTYLFIDKGYETKGAISGSTYTCPIGYRTLTETDLDELIKITDLKTQMAKFTNITFSADVPVLSVTKVFPDATSGANNDSWRYFAIDVSAAEVKKFNYHTFFTKGGVGLCALDATTAEVSVNSYDFMRGYKYVADLKTANVYEVYWEFGEETDSKKSIDVWFTKNGCNTLKMWGAVANGDKIFYCKKIWVSNIDDNDSAVTVTETTIKTKNFEQKAVFNNQLFFNHGTAQIVALMNGEMIIVYSEDATKTIKGLVLNEDKTLKEEVSLITNAVLFSAAHTENGGIVIYAEDSEDPDRSFIQEFDSTFTSKFSRNIMNNGKLPTGIKDQVVFEKDGKPLSGLQAMFNPNNGRIMYSRDTLGLLFAHYNNFKAGTGTREDHTGDTFFQFDAATGKNEKYAWAWKTSHSNVQQAMYDGKYYVTASLGDIYPENITVCVIQPSHETGEKLTHHCEEILSYKLPGDGKGYTCGRLGGISKKQNLYAIVFSVQPCSLNSSTSRNFVGLVTFNYDGKTFTNKREMSFNQGDGQKIVTLRSQKLGASLLVVTHEREENNNQNQKMSIREGDKSYATVVSFEGTVEKAKFALDQTMMSASDPISVLDGGNIAWVSLDADNKIKLHYTEEAFATKTKPYSDHGSVLESTDSGTTAGTNSTWIAFNLALFALGFLI